MKDLRDLGGSNPLPYMHSRLTDCAGYISHVQSFERLYRIVFLIAATMVCFVFLSGDSFLRYDLKSRFWCDAPVLALRPTEKLPYASSCMINIDSIIMTDILRNDLRLNKPLTDHTPLKLSHD